MGIFNTISSIFSNKEEYIESPITNVITEHNLINTSSEKKTGGYVESEPEIFKVGLKDWQNAVDSAWSISNPSRVELADIYLAMTTYDSQVITAINQRKLLTIQGSLNFYNEDGKVNEEATKLIKSPSGATKLWFRDFMSLTLDAIFWGFELIAIDYKNDKIIVKKIPERHVVPNKGAILKDSNSGYYAGNAIDYNKGKLDLITCKVNYNSDLNYLGLLNGCAPLFFSKVTGNWKQHVDKFGQLTRILKTNPENKQKLMASYTAMKNHLRSNFLVIGHDDEMSFEGDTRTQLPYLELNDYCDGGISKIILGQSSTTDEKSFAGSANVHQDVLNSIIVNDREFLESVVNDQLIPKLQMMGLLPDKIYFAISEMVNVDLVEQSNIIKTLSDAGYKATKEYIEDTFNIPIEDMVAPIESTTEDNDESNNDDNINNRING